MSSEDSPPQRPVRVRPFADQLPQGVAPRREAPSKRPSGEVSAAPPRPRLPVAPIAPGSQRGAVLSAREIMSQRHRERVREQRRRRRDFQFAVAAAGLILLAFLTGFFWPSAATSARGRAALDTDPAQREAALAKIDEAVRARFAERYEEAATLAGEARRLDPSVPGPDLIVAEIGMLQQDPDAVRSSTTQAIRRKQNVSDALVLQGIDTWMARGLKGQNSAEALESSLAKLQEAAAADLSNPAVWFFRGELLREGGRVRDAQQSMLGALHRQQPWQSAEFLNAKLAIAREEARSGPSAAESLADLPPAAALHRALAAGRDPAAPLAALAGRLTARQTRLILDDPALGGSANDAIRGARTSAGIAVEVPGGAIPAPDHDSPPVQQP